MRGSARQTDWAVRAWTVQIFGSIAAVLVSVGLSGCASPPDSDSSGAPISYARQIQPLLETHCYECHGSSLTVPSGKFRLDRRADLLRGGRSGQPSITPGEGATSPLVIVISGGDGERWRPMPPRGEGLNGWQASLVERWIDEGASFDD